MTPPGPVLPSCLSLHQDLVRTLTVRRNVARVLIPRGAQPRLPTALVGRLCRVSQVTILILKVPLLQAPLILKVPLLQAPLLQARLNLPLPLLQARLLQARLL